MEFDQDRQGLNILNFQKQLKIFNLRIQTSSHTNEETDMLQNLSFHIYQLQRVAATGNICQELSRLSESLQSSESLAACFLTQFVGYVQSTLDMEDSLDTVKEFINYFLPCIHTAMKRSLGKQVLSKILCKEFLFNLYKSVISTFKRGSQYQKSAVKNLLEYQSNWNKIVKAHVIRMNSGDSKKLFQETFGDCGNTEELYLIYVWQIYMIYEVKERESLPPSLHCITEVMENSGKYVVVVPARDMKKMSLNDPFSPAGRYYSTLTDYNKLEVHHPIPDLAFEWTDFRIGILYPNGVVFLVNSASWDSCLQEISATIEDLEVKRSLKFVPSLGCTFGLPLKDNASIHKKIEGVRFIRVRVVRITQAECRVYGVDSGSFHQCNYRSLILLPASVINMPPCGRLARLPVVPVPPASSMASTVALLVALAQADPVLNFCFKGIQQTSLWLQVEEMEVPTLRLLKTLMNSPATDYFVSTVAFVAAEHLLRLKEHNQLNKETTPLVISILTSAIQKSSRISLTLVRGGIFITLCEAALAGRHEETWRCLRALLSREELKRECGWQAHHNVASHYPAPGRSFKKHQPWPTIVSADLDSFPAAVQMATITTPYHDWGIIMQPAVISPQLASCHFLGAWRCDEEEVVPSHTGIFEKGHYLGVKTDLTHHIMQERNVSSICLETLLKIILGMLNTHRGGKIYIGLNQSGVVQGVKINRDQQDSLMLGFTKLVRSDIYPSLLPCDSHVQFVPVVQPGGTSQSEFTYYLIVLTVEPEPHQVYFSQEFPEKLYVRKGDVTLPLHGSHRADILLDYRIWTQDLEKHVI